MAPEKRRALPCKVEEDDAAQETFLSPFFLLPESELFQRRPQPQRRRHQSRHSHNTVGTSRFRRSCGVPRMHCGSGTTARSLSLHVVKFSYPPTQTPPTPQPPIFFYLRNLTVFFFSSSSSSIQHASLQVLKHSLGSVITSPARTATSMERIPK